MMLSPTDVTAALGAVSRAADAVLRRFPITRTLVILERPNLALPVPLDGSDSTPLSGGQAASMVAAALPVAAQTTLLRCGVNNRTILVEIITPDWVGHTSLVCHTNCAGEVLGFCERPETRRTFPRHSVFAPLGPIYVGQEPTLLSAVFSARAMLEAAARSSPDPDLRGLAAALPSLGVGRPFGAANGSSSTSPLLH